MAVKLFPTLEAAEAHILKHELTYTVKYVSRKQEKSFTQPIDAGRLFYSKAWCSEVPEWPQQAKARCFGHWVHFEYVVRVIRESAATQRGVSNVVDNIGQDL